MLKFIELKVPPPIVVLIFGYVMWVLHRCFPVFHSHLHGGKVISISIAAIAIILGCLALSQFVQWKTTVNPMKINNASALITTGLFSISRNPIYIVDLLLLFSWVIWLGQWVNIALLPFFIIYLNRFQIEPEERVLKKIFGAKYEKYCSATRRWI